ncbi:medium-chain acyl-CoA ligase ACSF2, mitochondrial-like [Pollicipes pollicipes]|uniref:medium-chain acyl-CoA ligase ACSF2, mitochondrial-like n=1 Tax=Pollicipes pollicipes TaxID=41117 RepID=UPI0018850EFA|nr:medium-chain acyl-CoA ligase ACSF2, mitochondrial-like [Pollicipes pollicipes]
MDVVKVAYGLTETSPLLTVGFPSDDVEHRCGTVGYPLDHCELKVVDESGQIAPPNTPGELCARSYSTFLGYWDDAEKTRASLTPQRWFLTGDVAVITEDGYVKIVGRAKDMVIRGGENIYPAEIEDFLMTHPDVMEAYAFGVPDERMGEELCVWVRSRQPGAVSEHDIRSFAKGRIAHYKVPRYIVFRDDFPKTVTGKVQKFVMRRMMAEELGLEHGVLRFDDLLDAGKESLSGELERRQAQVDCDDPCSIQFTSGTTGLPKGATLTHHNVVNNMLMMAGRVGFDAGGARICMSVPLYHCFGCVGGSVMAPLHGNTLVFPSPVFNATASLQATQDERCTHMYGTPTMFVDMVNLPELERLDLSTLRSGLVAGAPVPFHLMEAMISKLGMQNSVVAYGLTETSPLLTVGFPSDDVEHRCGTVGYPLDHCELKVVDESGQIAPPNTPGELCARSYSTFLGYWDDAEKTRASLTPQRWFLTGDVAVITEDGYVKIVGRAKDMVIRGGENIYPAEIEDFLMTHPDVMEAYAFGVPDERMGEELCVWVRSRQPGAVSEHDIRSFAKGRIAHYKVPRYIMFRDDFPKTVTGKVQKFVMRRMMAEELGLEQ